MQDEVAVVVGRRFQIILVEVPSSGHVWSIRYIASAIRLLSTEYVGSPPQEVGGSYEKQFTFVANRVGQFIITFELKRPWESSPIEVREVRILVSSDQP
jgi:hypothetical protein